MKIPIPKDQTVTLTFTPGELESIILSLAVCENIEMLDNIQYKMKSIPMTTVNMVETDKIQTVRSIIG